MPNNIREMVALPDPPLPRRLADFPDYASMSGRLEQISARRHALVARLAEIDETLRRQSAQTAEARDLLTSRESVADVLDAHGVDPALTEERRKVKGDIATLEEAARVGHLELRQVARRRAGEALADLRKWHQSIVGQIGEHLLALLRLAIAEQDAATLAEDAGFDRSGIAPFGPSSPSWVDAGAVAQWFRDQVQAGLIPATKQPARDAVALDHAPTPRPRFRQHATPTPSANGKVRS